MKRIIKCKEILFYCDYPLTFYGNDKQTDDNFIFSIIDDEDDIPIYIGFKVLDNEYEDLIAGLIDLRSLYLLKDIYYYCKIDSKGEFFIYKTSNTIKEKELPSKDWYFKK
jgi:hypothetical protein